MLAYLARALLRSYDKRLALPPPAFHSEDRTPRLVEELAVVEEQAEVEGQHRPSWEPLLMQPLL